MNYSLRKLEGNSKDIIYNWRNMNSIRSNMYNDQPIPYETHCQWFENILQNQNELYRLFFYEENPIGLVSFKNTNSQSQTCVWGFYIGEKNSPKGSGTIMGSLALDYAFYSLNMMKVIGEVLSFNEISQQFHKKLGFVNKGLLQNNIIRNNEFIDVVSYEISKKQWEEQKKLLF
ncbi:UDP-4-amino-4,6-dideoxy-N-acetyl-beta-L-altrosamine N-acetyltransferase [Neobacillus sp. PS3-40]|uniref:UDP-4-amino-4, 6-dideoxy-N-acetyl-beta-L-altrosamine N-acetyltransferase n=1 Tax=Neobacillus sp. PS3-40 TaxID=3070679 RepID=UPI0027E09746|nr:UDP-4-amino-4,6-dideoxy-N-acetyl-beta-L-altrosamine N-acetyltransferase [Neobacillus sp. PS3-40]WML46077.1 UDP-4-amino-4,6-dideoxy-N-acetyl-beta-L-altrosamine N-acetyltransferase [Neobacillus sp. PS3-40]